MAKQFFVGTPHISAKKEDIASIVLLPGDPLRAAYIAKKYFENSQLVNNVRNIQGYTGYYKNVKLTVMGSGMGCPSLGIYVNELFDYYDVKVIIRIGSCGGCVNKLNLYDIVLAKAASYNAGCINAEQFPGCYAPSCDSELLQLAYQASIKLNKPVKVRDIFTSDLFYGNENIAKELPKYNICGIEMESAYLYMLAAKKNKKAISVLVCSDIIGCSEQLSADQRERSLNDGILISLETAISVNV